MDKLPRGARLIKECEFYCVDAKGVVYSCRTKGGRFRPWTAMAPWRSGNDRLSAALRIPGRKNPITRGIHVLVATAFIGPRPEGTEVCHWDGNPSNNNLRNLRWDTHSGNLKDRHRHGTHMVGVRNPAAKLNEKQVIRIRHLYSEGIMQKDIAPMFGISKQAVQVICARENWNHLK